MSSLSGNSSEALVVRSGTTPYLSLVVTARNDNHGGNLLGRMQIFIDAWLDQTERYQLDSELIIVEWNPPTGRERLARALRWPDRPGFCQVRIIGVPAEIHERYRHAAALPLFQMIAKNVGIRRARGRFILATNIDVIFSDELARFLASRQLVPGRMYRADRWDVMADVPPEASVDDQLEYCRQHVIRLCAREGFFAITPEGFRKNDANDICRPESEIHFGEGWFSPESWSPGQRFRWIENEAIVFFRAPAADSTLKLVLEPGPGVGPLPHPLQIFDGMGGKVADLDIAGHTTIRLSVPGRADGSVQSLRFHVPDGGRPILHDPRILNFRFFVCDWTAGEPESRSGSRARAIWRARRILARALANARRVHGAPAVALKSGPSLLLQAGRMLADRSQDVFGDGITLGAGWYPVENAEGVSFRWASDKAELVIIGAGETRDLELLIEPRPCPSRRYFTLDARSAGGEAQTSIRMGGLSYVRIPVSGPRGAQISVALALLEGGERIGVDPRVLGFRVFASHYNGPSAKDILGGTALALRPVNIQSEPVWVDWSAATENCRREIESMGRPAYLHMNACGDFTLMAREHWFDLRSYPELHQFSMNIDTMLCYAAYHSGAEEEVLESPMRVYHIEHGAGSGWTPEGRQQLEERLSRKGIPSVSYEDLTWFIAEMRKLKAPLVFNLEDWGLATFAFDEYTPHATDCASRVAR